MSLTNVAVFPCGSEVGLEIHRALRHYIHFKLIGLSSVDDYGGVLYEHYVGDLPFLTHESFFDAIRKVVKEQQIDFLIPSMDEVGFQLKSREFYLGCKVVYPPLDLAKILRRKTSMYKALERVVKTPKIFSGEKEIIENLPVFIKPDVGYGSRGARKITFGEELLGLNMQLENYVVCEYLAGPEYTVDCFSASSGQLLFAGARKRARIRMGISVRTETVNDPRFELIAENISVTLGMEGAWFFQLKENSNGDLILLEVASRVSGSMALYRGLGINFIALDLFQRMGHPISIPSLNGIHARMERSFDCKVEMELNFKIVYCDLDDCLITKETLNTNLLRFLAQCLNQNKKLVLITRHSAEPQETLRRFRLTDFFDQIIHIKDRNISKAAFIESTASIFIDDSFSERDTVKARHQIPVFSPDAIDLLISEKA